MIVLGLDFETTGLDTDTARIIEVGALLWDTQAQAPVVGGETSVLAFEPGYPDLSPEVSEITGITQELLDEEAIPLSQAFELLFLQMAKADYIVAHNKAFDRAIFEKECERQNLTPPKLPWFCTYLDIPYPARYRCKQLSHLALDHGIAVDPKELHRAIGDLRYLFQILAKYPFEILAPISQEPWLIVQALVSYQSREWAKQKGFRWQECLGKEYTSAWVKAVKRSQLEASQKGWPFLVKILEEISCD